MSKTGLLIFHGPPCQTCFLGPPVAQVQIAALIFIPFLDPILFCILHLIVNPITCTIRIYPKSNPIQCYYFCPRHPHSCPGLLQWPPNHSPYYCPCPLPIYRQQSSRGIPSKWKSDHDTPLFKNLQGLSVCSAQKSKAPNSLWGSIFSGCRLPLWPRTLDPVKQSCPFSSNTPSLFFLRGCALSLPVMLFIQVLT